MPRLAQSGTNCSALEQKLDGTSRVCHVAVDLLVAGSLARTSELAWPLLVVDVIDQCPNSTCFDAQIVA